MLLTRRDAETKKTYASGHSVNFDSAPIALVTSGIDKYLTYFRFAVHENITNLCEPYEAGEAPLGNQNHDKVIKLTDSDGKGSVLEFTTIQKFYQMDTGIR
jgi:hypothetical protein